MQHVSAPFKVYVGLVSTGYLNPEAISRTVSEGISFCGVSGALQRLGASNPILLQPDISIADSKIARHAYTHPEITRAVLEQVFTLNKTARATILGRSLNGFSTSRALTRAHGEAEAFRLRGYGEFEHLYPGRVELAAEEDAEQYRYQLSMGTVLSAADKRTLLNKEFLINEDEPKLLRSRLNNEVLAARNFHDANFIIYCPKLKSSVFAQGFSGAIRLGDTSYRGTFSDFHLCDLLEVSNPHLIVSDGIIAAVGGNEITQRGHELGVVLISNNALAHDLVAARIFNLDPMRINHLRIAAERGWGPSTYAQIELGGVGAEGIRQLGQKTRFWDLGYMPLGDFGAKYERENPGLTFPLEIISGLPYESAGAHGMLLDWLYLIYDFPRRRVRISRWPKSSICVGNFRGYPSRYLVYVVGDRACEALHSITSSSRKIVTLRSVQIKTAQFKDGRRHLVICIAGSPPRLRQLSLAFFVASAGAMVARVQTPTLLIDRLALWLHSWLKPRSNSSTTRLVMTSRMARNSWWSLKQSPAAAPALETETPSYFK